MGGGGGVRVIYNFNWSCTNETELQKCCCCCFFYCPSSIAVHKGVSLSNWFMAVENKMYKGKRTKLSAVGALLEF